MLNNDTLTKAAAWFKSDAQKRFDKALAALVALAWKYKYLGGDFRFDADPELYAEALRICREMSDGCLEDAQKIIQSLFEEEDALDEEYVEDTLQRFDMAGSHLISLLDLWIAFAFENNIPQRYTVISVVNFLNNPFTPGLFKEVAKQSVQWGTGYSRNLVNQITVIGQNFIIDRARLREWIDESAKGALYYIRRRGSNFECPECDDMCGFPIPIDVPFERLHSRCVCWPEYIHEDILK